MKHPTIEQLDYVISKLKSVLPQASKENAFDMREGKVYYKSSKFPLMEIYKCGTVHCTGGWYAVANLMRKFIKSKYDRGYVSYEDGAHLMAIDLGFNSVLELQSWADDNPNIWDNKYGDNLFSLPSAYNSPGFAGVVKQFELARSNLMKLKEK